ncbi:MAG: hypothetical protein ACJAX5_000409 [Patiriisocius sp.]|jgi:hypothetical protein
MSIFCSTTFGSLDLDIVINKWLFAANLDMPHLEQTIGDKPAVNVGLLGFC